MRNLSSLYVDGVFGIGTTSPGYKLDVNGNFRATSTIYANGDINSNGGNILRFTVGVNAASGFTVYNAAENGYLSNRITTDAHSRGWGWELTNSTANAASVTAYHRFGYGSSALSWLANGTGNVGIGTTSPGNKLHVNGDVIRVVNSTFAGIESHNTNGTWESYIGTESGGGGNRYNSASSQHTFYNNSSAVMRINGSGNVGIGTTTPNHKVDIYSNENVPLRIHRPSNANLDSSGAWGIGFSTRGDANNSTTDTRAGIFSYYNGNLFLAAANTSIVADPDTYARLTVLNTGNVGIGTTSPSYKLDVAGDVQVQSAYFLRFANEWGIQQTGTNLNFAEIGSADGRLYLKAGGNVGIGTTSPVAGLHVQSASTKLFLSNTDFASGSTGSGMILQTGASSGNTYSMIYGFQSGNTSYANLVIPGGNVGIGTTSPSALLHVNKGTVGEVARLGAGNYQLTFGVTTTYGEIQAVEQGVAYRNLLLNRSGGNVLIGTSTDAGYKLQVSGDAIISGASKLYLRDSLTYIWESSGLTLDSGHSTRPIKALIGGSEKFRVHTDGNVGIGTTTPNQKLQVVGNIAATGSRLNFLVKGITVEGSPQGGTYKGYILLAKAYTTGTVAASYAMGKIYARRGTATTGLNLDIYEVTSSTGYNGEQLTINVVGSQSPRFIRTCKVTYGGVVYHAIESSASGGEPSTELTFEGVAYDTPLIMTDESYVSSVTAYGNLATTTDAVGRVGIGTNSLSEKLTVDGHVLLTDSGLNQERLILFKRNGGDVGKLTATSLGLNLQGLANKRVGIVDDSNNGLYVVDGGNVLIGTTTDNGKKLQVNGDVFIKGSGSASSTKIFEVQNSSGTSIMDFRGDAYAFFGCGQGGGAASGFIFRYNDTSHVQFTGYNYGNGSGSYKPILLDTDLVGRGQGIYVNFGGTGYANPAPLSSTEFAVRGRTSDASQKVMQLHDSNNNEIFSVQNDGAVFTQGSQGWTGTVSIPNNPPGSQNLEFKNGILINVF